MLTGIVLFTITLIFTFVASIQSYILIPAEVLCGVAVVQVIFSIAAPSTRFGHWKDNRYKEKLEWDAFSRFLSDMAIFQKHAPADLSMWGEWLVYGTALGVGDKVERAMKALNIRVAETGVSLGIMGINDVFVPLMLFSPQSYGGSGGSGGLVAEVPGGDELFTLQIPETCDYDPIIIF